jgi:hypothetical protein
MSYNRLSHHHANSEIDFKCQFHHCDRPTAPTQNHRQLYCVVSITKIGSSAEHRHQQIRISVTPRNTCTVDSCFLSRYLGDKVSQIMHERVFWSFHDSPFKIKINKTPPVTPLCLGLIWVPPSLVRQYL